MLATDRLARAALMLVMLWDVAPRDVPRLARLALELADQVPTAMWWSIITARGSA